MRRCGISCVCIGNRDKGHELSPLTGCLVLHSEILGGLAGSPVLCPAQDRNDLAEKALILTKRSNGGYVRLY
jgi:hypothetical protein